jgi:hypothetical protein
MEPNFGRNSSKQKYWANATLPEFPASHKRQSLHNYPYTTSKRVNNLNKTDTLNNAYRRSTTQTIDEEHSRIRNAFFVNFKNYLIRAMRMNSRKKRK